MLFRWQNSKKRFKGTWNDRLDSLFGVGVDYTGKSILDLGCNMGVIAYEIAKQKPLFIHGIDKYKPHIFVANTIFEAVPVESRFDCAAIGSSRFERLLRPSYDIVMMLAVYHHFRRHLKPEVTRATIKSVAGRASTVVVRDPGKTVDELGETLAEIGYRKTDEAPPTDEVGGLTVFRR